MTAKEVLQKLKNKEKKQGLHFLDGFVLKCLNIGKLQNPLKSRSRKSLR